MSFNSEMKISKNRFKIFIEKMLERLCKSARTCQDKMALAKIREDKKVTNDRWRYRVGLMVKMHGKQNQQFEFKF